MAQETRRRGRLAVVVELGGAERETLERWALRFSHNRIRALLYAGKPNWALLATIAPRQFPKRLIDDTVFSRSCNDDLAAHLPRAFAAAEMTEAPYDFTDHLLGRIDLSHQPLSRRAGPGRRCRLAVLVGAVGVALR